MGRIKSSLLSGVAAVIAVSVMSSGCSSESSINETVATVNGARITVMEVREAIGIPGGMVPAATLTKEEKKKIVDEIAETRLLAQEARDRGFANSPEFQNAVRSGEAGLAIKGLFRKELDARGKKVEGRIDAAAKDLMAKDKNLKHSAAWLQSGQTIFSELIGQIQTDLISKATKAFPGKIDESAIARITKGDTVQDNMVVGTVGADRVTYGEAKLLIGKASQGGQHAGKDFTKDGEAIKRVITQEMSNRSLVAYAKQQGGDKGPWSELDRSLLENSVLINLLAGKEIFKNLTVSDKEIEDTYNEHKEMFSKEGKAVPLADVRGEISSFIQNNKRRQAVEAFIAPMKAKAKITVTESLLAKV